MSYEIIAIPNFKREIKKLAKKFPSLKNDFAQLLENLEQEPMQGTGQQLLQNTHGYHLKR